MKEFNSILYYHAMENIVYSKSEFFDSINSSYNSMLKKKPLQPIMNNEKILSRGDLEIMQTRARDSFKNSFSDISFPSVSQSLLSPFQKLVLMLQ